MLGGEAVNKPPRLNCLKRQANTPAVLILYKLAVYNTDVRSPSYPLWEICMDVRQNNYGG